ncbi:hypothetical protein BJ508DRAFT_351421 [Ascobolus immersus RN42]|uniref:Uncharacterized protein n=1 Tax=Ascobolus immersus RN42 TaxID=1160509 RepID=A0A3N4HVV3_ASCIM|nr:hypothetical protein BJ508DRAFT_351421 [Ascobolus immersus RN42]
MVDHENLEAGITLQTCHLDQEFVETNYGPQSASISTQIRKSEHPQYTLRSARYDPSVSQCEPRDFLPNECPESETTYSEAPSEYFNLSQAPSPESSNISITSAEKRTAASIFDFASRTGRLENQRHKRSLRRVSSDGELRNTGLRTGPVEVPTVYLPKFISASRLAYALLRPVSLFLAELADLGHNFATRKTIFDYESARSIASDYGFRAYTDLDMDKRIPTKYTVGSLRLTQSFENLQTRSRERQPLYGSEHSIQRLLSKLSDLQKRKYGANAKENEIFNYNLPNFHLLLFVDHPASQFVENVARSVYPVLVTTYRYSKHLAGFEMHRLKYENLLSVCLKREEIAVETLWKRGKTLDMKDVPSQKIQLLRRKPGFEG